MINKKSISDVFLVFVFGVFVLFILTVITPRLIGTGSAETSKYLSKTGNYDRDPFSDYYDACACEYSDVNEGCPIGAPTTGSTAKAREEACEKTIKASTT